MSLLQLFRLLIDLLMESVMRAVFPLLYVYTYKRLTIQTVLQICALQYTAWENLLHALV